MKYNIDDWGTKVSAVRGYCQNDYRRKYDADDDYA